LLGAADGVTELVSAAQLYLAEGEAPTPEVAKPAKRQRRGAATGPQKASRSRYAIDPAAIAAGKLAKSVGRLDQAGSAASAIGAALDFVRSFEQL
jgi:hypothetical protein